MAFDPHQPRDDEGKWVGGTGFRSEGGRSTKYKGSGKLARGLARTYDVAEKVAAVGGTLVSLYQTAQFVHDIATGGTHMGTGDRHTDKVLSNPKVNPPTKTLRWVPPKNGKSGYYTPA